MLYLRHQNGGLAHSARASRLHREGSGSNAEIHRFIKYWGISSFG